MDKLGKFLYYGIIIGIAYFLFPLFLPFIFALIFAIVFEPVVKQFQSVSRFKRNPSVLLIYTVSLISMFSISYHFLSGMVSQIVEFGKKLPKQINSVIESNQHIYKFYQNLPAETKEYLTRSLNALSEKSVDFMSSFASNLFSIASNFPGYLMSFLVFLIALYLMGFQFPTLKKSFLNFFEAGETQQKIEIVLTKLRKAIIGFIQAQVILSTMTFVVAYIGLFVLKAPYLFLSSMLILLVDLLPILGAAAVLIPWSIYSFAVGDLYLGAGLGTLCILMTVLRRVMEPKLLGSRLGISALTTLISMFVGFSLFGVLGTILGPTLIIILKAFQEAKLIKAKIKF